MSRALDDVTMDDDLRRTLSAFASRVLPSGPPSSAAPSSDAPSSEAPPSDERALGAAEAAVGDYLPAVLAHPYYRGLRPQLEGLLRQLDAAARERCGRSFDDCAAEVQDELVRGVAAAPNPLQQYCFDTLVRMTIEGFLADPVHGGNRDGAGWRFAGLRPDTVRTGFCLNPREATVRKGTVEA